jgi:hypothetical protein
MPRPIWRRQGRVSTLTAATLGPTQALSRTATATLPASARRVFMGRGEVSRPRLMVVYDRRAVDRPCRLKSRIDFGLMGAWFFRKK